MIPCEDCGTPWESTAAALLSRVIVPAVDALPALHLVSP